MKRIILLIVTFAICAACTLSIAAQAKAELPANIADMAGKDSADLLGDPTVESRLKNLMGDAGFDSFKESFETVTPVTKTGTFLFTSGCLIHACSQVESAIAIDLKNKTVHTAIFRRGEKTKFFNENKKTPKAIKDWASRLANLKK